jgi:apolipoprotein N-acyltransferase
LTKAGLGVGALLLLSLNIHPTSVGQDALKQSVRLLQANVNPNNKFLKPEEETDWYLGHMASSAAQLTIAPETAMAGIGAIERMRPWYDQWRLQKRPDQGLIVGAMQAMGDDYANAAWGFMDGQLQMHLKVHLVPFGEFSPPGFEWFAKQLRIPYSNFTRPEQANRGFKHQQQVYGLSICYEDLFGDEMAQAFVDSQSSPPTTLINLSNLAWFGDGMALDQHLIIGRMRAKEFQRPMIMSTNSGWSAIIDDTGRVQAQLPKGQRAILDVTYRGVQSTPTPYAQWAGRWGHLPLWMAQLLLLLGLGYGQWRRSRHSKNTNIAT